MSRTKMNIPAPGKEYDSKRPGNKNGAVPGKISKTITKRRERQAARAKAYSAAYWEAYSAAYSAQRKRFASMCKKWIKAGGVK